MAISLDDIMDASPPGPQEPTLLLGAEEAYVFTEYRAATIELRDAELLLRAKQERYRKALEALNQSIAKVGA